MSTPAEGLKGPALAGPFIWGRTVLRPRAGVRHFRMPLLLLLVPLLLLGACRDSSRPTSLSPELARLLADPVIPVMTELPSEALPAWREAMPVPGTLVLLSVHPFLQPIEAERAGEVAALVRTGSREQFLERGSFYRADPALVPTETVSAALLGGLVKEIVWVFPTSSPVEQLSLDTFRRQLTDAAFLTEPEVQGLTLASGVFHGTVRGVPFRAVHPGALPKIDGPFVVHLDLGYYRGLYQGEVKTPLYDLLHQSCRTLQGAGWRPQAVTLSFSTIEGANSHDVRFLLSNLADILRDPALLDSMPPGWAKRGEALYAANFFLDSKVREIYRQNAAEYRGDATAQYDEYKSLFSQRQVSEALIHLDKAVSLDPGYAAAYLELAQIAEQDGNLAAALNLLEKAGKVFPENPFIDLYRARYLVALGRVDEAAPLILRLERLPWSKRLHAEIPAAIADLADAAKINRRQ